MEEASALVIKFKHSLYLSVDIEITWRAVFSSSDSHYVRTFLSVQANHPVKIRRVDMMTLGAKMLVRDSGSVQGLPLIFGNCFAAVEFPMAFAERLDKV